MLESQLISWQDPYCRFLAIILYIILRPRVDDIIIYTYIHTYTQMLHAAEIFTYMTGSPLW